MANNLDKSKYIKVKKDWLNIIYEISENYIKNYKPLPEKAMEYVILLKKK